MTRGRFGDGGKDKEMITVGEAKECIALRKRSHLKSADAGAKATCRKLTMVRSVETPRAPHDKALSFGVAHGQCLPRILYTITVMLRLVSSGHRQKANGGS